jgi:cation/acetate symporter
MAVAQKRSAPVWQNYLARRYGLFTIALIIFSFFVGMLEYAGILGTRSIGYLFLLLTIGMYAFIGIMSRTKHLDEYYVAGRSVPAVANGMATGADWMSAASFISMAGTLWLLGYDGLAYIMGWTGGYVLLALLFAPYIRKFGQYTIPDFVGARYEGNKARVVASIAAILVSFTYVTAQVSGVGIIMGRLVGVDYPVGVVIGLAGVLVCSFLGGMKAVTWTQVAQYIILIIAYLVPVTMLSISLTGNPIPQMAYGEALQNIDRLEQEQGLTNRYVQPFTTPLSNASAISAAEQIGLPPPEPLTNRDWLGTPWQFLALTACLMLGTAGLPHILIRFYTVPSVKESRKSVGYALFFIFLLYFTAPAYAAFSRWEMLQNVVGQRVDQLPAWAANWSATGLLTIADDPAKGGNGDNILQFSELKINPDLVVLATPEIAGLPYTIAALVAAGGLAAALSTADGLLVVIASAVAHDVFYKTLRPNASQKTRIAVGKGMILVGAACAALAALPRLALIAQMVAWAFSLAAASFFPIILLGIFWKRANGAGAIAGIIGGLVVTIFYMAMNYVNPNFNILGISHVAAGIFGMPVNFALTIIVSLLTKAPSAEIQQLVESLRRPDREPEGHDLRQDTGEGVFDPA